VSDIVQGIEAALEKVQNFEIVNLGESRTVELNDLIERIEKIVGKPSVIEEFPPRPEDVPETCADITKAKKLLGYDPKVPLEEGLEKFWAWYQETRETVAAGSP
jgi:UDP-glucuronate 4-epimerase